MVAMTVLALEREEVTAVMAVMTTAMAVAAVMVARRPVHQCEIPFL